MEPSSLLTKSISFILSLLQLLYWYIEGLYRFIILPPLQPIDGETILVTGAVGGIGKEICKHIARCGSDIKLVLWDLNEAELEKFAFELRMIGKRRRLQAFPFAVDISTRDNIDNCCQKVKDMVGPVTIIFNNAGIAQIGNFLRLTNEQIDKTFQINLMAHFWIIRQFLPDMVLKNHGRIVNICSVGGLRAGPIAFAYFASKHAVHGYTESLKMELEMFKHDGIHVTAVYPFFVKTPLIKTLDMETNNSYFSLPGLFPVFQEAAHVGKETVDGMRREYEYIYFPTTLPSIVMICENLLPMKFRKIFQGSYRNCFLYRDEKDQKEYAAPFCNPVEEKSGNEDEAGNSSTAA